MPEDDAKLDGSVDTLIERMYTDLRRLAASKLRRLAPGQTLTPTSLVHEVYTRLLGRSEMNFADDREFFLTAARSMRDVLIDRARQKGSLKRGGGRRRVDLNDVSMAVTVDDDTLLELDELLCRLKVDDEVDHQLAMLRFYAGLNEQQTADALGISLRSMQRRWQYIRARLYGWITREPPA